jgi:aspartate/methionine/tyrosine aminotransferase
MAPGTAFGKGAEKLIRLCYAKTPPLLHEAMDRLADFTSRYVEDN